MSLSSMLHLEKLTLRNFRCFSECEVGLPGRLTVLVAENGRGKTAILEDIGLTLGLFVDARAGQPSSKIQVFTGRRR